MKNKFVIFLLFILIIIPFIYWKTQNSENMHNKISIRLKWLHQSQFAGFYFADKAGLYKTSGLNVTLNPGGVDFPAIQMVAGGSDQFGIASFEQIIIARSKGIPVVAIANIYRQTPLVIFSFANKNIKEPKDLIGKKVAITLDPDEQLVYQSILKKANIDRSKIKEEIFKYDPSLLLTGKVDAMLDYAISKPLSVEAETGKKINEIHPSDYGINFYADTLFTTQEMINTNPELVHKIVDATVKGWEKALDNQDLAVTYTLQYNNQLKRNQQAKMFSESKKYIYFDKKSPMGFMDKKVVDNTQKFLLENKYINRPLDLGDIYTNEFIRTGK